MTKKPEVLAFQDLQPYLLLKNGNYLYKVPYRDGWAVLKVYYGSRGWWGRVQKSFVNVALHGQTSYMPKTRCRIERECVHLWRSCGFRVFGLYEGIEVEAPGCVPGGYLLFEYVKAPRLIDYLLDGSRTVEDRLSVYRRFLEEWGRRHELAIERREPRLVHENGDAKHVLILEDELLWFDFEMVYRSRTRVAELVSHEIVQYLWFLLKMLPPDLGERILDLTIARYPDRSRLREAPRFFLDHPNPAHRLLRLLDRKLSKRARKPTSKYNVATRLGERVDGAGETTGLPR